MFEGDDVRFSRWRRAGPETGRGDLATQRWGRHRMSPRLPHGAPDRKFVFVRMMYRIVTCKLGG
jgi:hypothetical protein